MNPGTDKPKDADLKGNKEMNALLRAGVDKKNARIKSGWLKLRAKKD